MTDDAAAQDADRRRVLLAVVGGAHGIRGECRVKSFTDVPEDFSRYGPLFDGKGNRFTVKSARPQKNMLLVRFAEVADRNHAERLNGTELFVDRSALPETEEDDEFYLEDLEGLEARSVTGEPIGRVVAVHNFGAGDILEIAPQKGPTVMIPFSEAAVPELDLEAGMLIVEPLAAGLVDAEGAEDEEAEEGEAGERPDPSKPEEEQP
ncbi:ribosome maturation factor RimM [Jiella pacifica]|uniref:Ribosome maturation factor RimM n=1 Tax=Jiella pacifica TaxID=2696469 RepID=A0A6N9T229_9HYPH|nr:ribosome maturation factor RimM [Jiella pacifica]NDW05413.1 ribosome maturation factor RimM [Jiella pacifica]